MLSCVQYKDETDLPTVRWGWGGHVPSMRAGRNPRCVPPAAAVHPAPCCALLQVMQLIDNELSEPYSIFTYRRAAGPQVPHCATFARMQSYPVCAVLSGHSSLPAVISLERLAALNCAFQTLLLLCQVLPAILAPPVLPGVQGRPLLRDGGGQDGRECMRLGGKQPAAPAHQSVCPASPGGLLAAWVVMQA